MPNGKRRHESYLDDQGRASTGPFCHAPSGRCTFPITMTTSWTRSTLTRFAGTDQPLRVVVAGVLIYLVGLLCYFPDAITLDDESQYLEAAYAFSKGSLCLDEIDPLSGEVRCRQASSYLPGTSAVLAPFIALFGWRGAYLVPALALAAATLCTALWLREAGRSPLFALMVLGYLPSLVLGRVAQSDAPSTALVALGLWLFWAGGLDRRARWAASGFVAGLSLSLRETNVLLFAPLYLGALIRRERGVGALIAGGLAGSLLRPLGTWIVFGDPLYLYPAGGAEGPPFGLSNLPGNLLPYAVALLVLVPGGLVGGLLYRGERRPEVVATVSLFFSLFLLFGYNGWTSGPRYFAPLTPLLAFAAAEALPRLWAGIRARFGAGKSATLERIAFFGIWLWVAGVLILAFAVHPVVDRLTDPFARVRHAIYEHSAAGSVVVMRLRDKRLVHPIFGERGRFYFEYLTPEIFDRLLAKYGTITVVLRDPRVGWYVRRQAREILRRKALENPKVLSTLTGRGEFELLFDDSGVIDDRLRIWRVSMPALDNRKRG